MDKSSYTFQALSEKYEDFRGPAFTIKLDGKTLDSTEMPIVQLDIKLSENMIGSASFSVESLYDYEKSQWINKLEQTIQVGAKLEISGGYGKQEPLFYGFVFEYNLEYSRDRPPRLAVRGMDGLAFLSNCHEPIYHGNKKPKVVIQEIFNKVISAGYAKSSTVDNLDNLVTPLVKELTSDYGYLLKLGKMYNLSLMDIQGELIFSDLIGNTSPIITLTLGAGLLSFHKRISLQHQLGKIEVRGKDINQKRIVGTASQVTVGDTSKKWAAQMAPAFKNVVGREYNECVRTEEECTRLAQCRLNARAMSLVQGVGRCVGLPELIPGRYISIKGVDAQTEGSYYISSVNHRFSREGYYTEFYARGART